MWHLIILSNAPKSVAGQAPPTVYGTRFASSKLVEPELLIFRNVVHPSIDDHLNHPMIWKFPSSQYDLEISFQLISMLRSHNVLTIPVPDRHPIKTLGLSNSELLVNSCGVHYSI